jgi:hypothetical protein
MDLSGTLDERAIQIEINKLEAKLITDVDNISLHINLVELYISLNNRVKAASHVAEGIKLFKDIRSDAVVGSYVVEAAIKYWKYIRYANKDSLRINTSSDRVKILQEWSVVISPYFV